VGDDIAEARAHAGHTPAVMAFLGSALMLLIREERPILRRTSGRPSNVSSRSQVALWFRKRPLRRLLWNMNGTWTAQAVRSLMYR